MASLQLGFVALEAVEFIQATVEGNDGGLIGFGFGGKAGIAERDILVLEILDHFENPMGAGRRDSRRSEKLEEFAPDIAGTPSHAFSASTGNNYFSGTTSGLSLKWVRPEADPPEQTKIVAFAANLPHDS